MATNGRGRGICIIPNCGEEAHYVFLGVCKACYAGLANWRGRSPQEKRLRLELNQRLVSRMDFILENPKHHPEKRK